MRNKMGNIVVGALFLVIGIGFLGDVLDAWNFDLFFDGWWTLFIIIPCVVGMVHSGINMGSLIGIAIGISLLLMQTDLLPLNFREMFLPLGIIVIGVLIIFKGFIFKGFRKSNHVSHKSSPSYTAIFGGQETHYDGQKFSGCDIFSIFGGVEIDLRKAIIEENVEISAVTIFGGGEIFLPPNVQVKISCLPIFGGIDNKVQNQLASDAPTVYINATCILGGLDIR